ncbi:GUN4 domain-containing protein [Tolypothrix sp. FACHB-123]|uniref:GUN4 domain-containing protein n=1 Tax=Tolypothrix sp. FACHB-123 TaxID=2692868 RepID=UPI0016840220|nr:GUN4 domain-containing protein [Tolypothrix sp. FACHB-123]MBD2354039.1 GUN4 domain-containing protein [Tolypothrix sp. FACHB-123]
MVTNAHRARLIIDAAKVAATVKAKKRLPGDKRQADEECREITNAPYLINSDTLHANRLKQSGFSDDITSTTMANPAKVIPLPAFIDNILSNLLKNTAASIARKLEEIASGYSTSAFLPFPVKEDTRYIEALIKYQDIFHHHLYELPIQLRSQFSKKLLTLLLEWQANQIQHRLKDIRKIFESRNLANIFSQEQSYNILDEGQKKYRLVVLVSPPNVSPNCPSSLQHDLPIELPEKLKAFLHKDYPPNSDLCPVGFYSDYFIRSITDADVLQLKQILADVPTLVLHSKITDYEVYFQLNFWHPQNSNIASISMPAWNWEEVKESLQAAEYDEIRAIRTIRQIIVTIHQLLAAFITDWYYLHLNPSYEPQLFHLESEFALGKWSADLLSPYIETIKDIYLQQKQVFQQSLKELTEHEYTALYEQYNKIEKLVITADNWAIEEEETSNISSKSGIHYSQLRHLLSENKWQEADEETSQILLTLAMPYRQNLALEQPEKITFNELFFSRDCVNSIPCEDLRIIDKLWLTYSNSHFGFSIQTCIWQSLIQTTKDVNLNCKDFVETVGWFVNENWRKDEEIIYEIDAPIGHLPFAFTKLFPLTEVNNWGEWYNFYYRLQTCEL